METKTALQTEDESKIMTSAIRQANGKRMYEMYFRIGNRKPDHKVFEIHGDLPQAISKARKHCDTMGYRFCGVYPFLVDLDIQEASRNDELHTTDSM